MTTNEKITQRSFFCDILTLLEGNEPQFTKDELMEYASGRVEKLDNVNAARRNAEKKITEKDLAKMESDKALRELAIATLEENEAAMTRNQLAEILKVTPAKVSTLMKELIANGTVAKGETKGEKGKIVAYSLA